MPFLIYAALFWLFLYIAVRIFDWRTARRLSGYLRSRNVSIYLGAITVHTDRFNTSLELLAKRHKAFLYGWFLCGTFFGLCGLFFSLLLLSSHLLASLGINPVPSFSALYYDHPRPTPLRPNNNIIHANARDGHVLFDIPSPAATIVDRGKAKLYTVRNWRKQSRSKKRAKLRGFHERAQIAAGHPPRRPSSPFAPPSQQNHNIPVVPPTASSTSYHQTAETNLHTSARFVVTQNTPPPTIITKQRARPSRVSPRTASPIHTTTAANVNKWMMIAPLLPGVTIPAYHVVYLAISILIAAAVHELGHALAAAAHKAQVAQVGGFFAFVFPGAFVQLEGVEKLERSAQLQVWCAGAWHNFVTAILALVIMMALPKLCIIFFSAKAGAIVVSLPEASPLRQYLHPGDVITHLGNFKVRNGGASFREALQNLTETNYSAGLCVSGDTFRIHAQNENRCCYGNTHSNRNLQCFHVAETRRRKTCLPDDVAAEFATCSYSPECRRKKREAEGEEHGRSALGRETCFKAEFADERRLIDIYIRSVHSGARHRIIYEGNAAVLRGAMSVSSYVPRLYGVMPASLIKWVARIDAPNHVHRLLQYFISVSLAIAFLNLAPVYKLDGEHTAMLVMKILATKMKTKPSNRVAKTIICFGTALLVINVVVAFAQLRNA